VAAIEEVLRWYETSHYHHMAIHSDSTSAIACTGQSGAGHGQERARQMQQTVARLLHWNRTIVIAWVKGHAGTPGNERADILARKAADKTAWSLIHLPGSLKAPNFREVPNDKMTV
jgi:ribonuclease HI